MSTKNNEKHSRSISVPLPPSLESTSKSLEPAYVAINDVRISPPQMIFVDAYDGKEFRNKLIIQNCGFRSSFIRLMEPNSATFKFNPFPRGVYLSPGMKIIRNVSYTFRRAFEVLQGFTTIWINDTEMKYDFTVILTASIISIEPQILDFGKIDAVNHAISRTFYLKNVGRKGCHFAIDLGTNSLDMVLDPLKGVLPALSLVPINVEIVGTHEGEFTEEFWVKTKPPQRVVVTGEFISPKLLVRKFINSLDFTLLDFPPTYYGSTSTQTLLIRNFSSSHSMFCIRAEIKGTTMTLEEACQIDSNYKNFIINPIDGRMAALKGVIIQITFAPLQTPTFKNYAACFLKVVRMNCRDTDSSEIEEDLHRTLHGSSSKTETHLPSISNYTILDANASSILSISQEDEILAAGENISFEHAIGLCLHGEIEKASISLRPTIFILKDLTLKSVYERELLISNNSSNLPLRVKYNKIASIDLRPQQFDLYPFECIEVLVLIRPLKMGKVEEKISFDLLAQSTYDSGKNKNNFRKVGTAAMKIFFEATKIDKMSRQNQCIVCKNDDMKLVPEFPYRLTSAELTKKMQNDDYYLQYLRRLQKKSVPLNEDLEDYDTKNKVSQRGGFCLDLDPLKKKTKMFTAFIPLAPRLLYNIIISPKAIKLQKVAAFTTITDFLEIENLNYFNINVFLKASKTSLVFENNSRYIISKNEKKRIYFSFSTSQIGRYYINISILINNATLYEVTAVANVVPKTLKLETTKIEFTEEDGHYKFFKLINALNAYTSFDWSIPEGCFMIYPQEGGIKAESFILCMVTYIPDAAQQDTAECVLTSESGQKRILTLSVKKRRHLVVFDNYSIDIGIIPLNTPIRRKVTVQNLKNFQVLFSVLNGSYIPGITVEPQEGILNGLDSQIFVINIHMKSVVDIDATIVFNIDEEEHIGIELKGSVEYPQFSFKPDTLQFRQISPNSVDTLALKITNLSACEATITFPVEEFVEFSVTELAEDRYNHQRDIIFAPNQSRILFLHFNPNYISTHSLYLPYVISGMLGPVYINNNQSSFSSYFFEQYNSDYEKIQGVTVRKTCKLLPTIRINCRAIDKSLEFSSLLLNLSYYGPNHHSNQTKCNFEITNTSTETVQICIRTDELQSPFSLDPKNDMNVEYYDVSYKVTLEAGSKAVFEAKFFPYEVGEYVVKLPIFLRHYFDNKIFNFLIIKGVYGLPTIVSSILCCNFESTPLGTTNQTNFYLYLQHHLENCELFIESEMTNLIVEFDKVNNNDVESTIYVTLSYEPFFTHCFIFDVIFHCTCRATCSIIISGVGETCLLTTYAFCQEMKEGILRENKKSKKVEMFGDVPRYGHLLINKNTTCFPLFPEKDDNSWYGEYMRNLLEAVENFLFRQIFYMRFYFQIPDGFSDFAKVKDPMRKMVFGGIKKPKLTDLPLLELMTNIVGARFRSKLAPSRPTEQDEFAWLRYTCIVNYNVLSYLKNYSIFIPHVKVKYLLNYDQYITYEKIKHPKEKPLKESIFYRRCKQAWLDLILQIIKIFYCYRTVPALDFEDFDKSLQNVRKQKQRYSLSEISRSTEDIRYEKMVELNFYGPHEKELIRWLKQCYDEEKTKLWPKALPKDKDWTFIDEDLRDGIILGAVTAHYCPYVRAEIKQMYPTPYNPEELQHNICVLIKTWQILKFSYIISPSSLQKCGLVESFFLINYLYVVLPFHYPRERVTIKAPLTQTNNANIQLDNLGDDTIFYQLVFFNNEQGLFRVTNETIILEPKSIKTIKVYYHAKTVKTATTTLLFSGETPGRKYAKSVVVSFVGVADVSFSCMTIPLTVDLYKICEVVLDVESPFKVEADYSLSFSYQQATTENTHLFSWDELKRLKTPKEFVFQDEMCHFDKEGKCSIKQLFCCQKQGPRDMWLYFTNPQVGDWGIQITLTGRITEPCFERINVCLPKNYKKLVCRCKIKPSITTNCPMIIKILIPKINNLLWDARKAMVLHNVQGAELNFWSNRIYTPTGTRILKLLFNSETHPMRTVIEDSVEYEVQLDKPKCFVTLRKICIDDIIDDDFYILPIHPIKDLSAEIKTQMKLVSKDGSETRFYHLFFINKDDENGSSLEVSST